MVQKIQISPFYTMNRTCLSENFSSTSSRSMDLSRLSAASNRSSWASTVSQPSWVERDQANVPETGTEPTNYKPQIPSVER